VSLLQSGKSIPAVIRELEFFKKATPDLLPGERGGSFVRLKTDLDLKRGLVVLNGGGDYPGGDYRVSKAWEVVVRQLPGRKEPVILKGQSGLFHRTYTDGMVQVGQAEIRPETESVLKIELRFPLLAKPGEPLILRRGPDYLLGHFVQSLT
jgi:translation elongation factor EF-Tu-like GTPase